MTPNKERIRKWVEALRSGKYKQGYGYLQSNGRFCCLGVACEVAIENGLDIKKVSIKNYTTYDGWGATLSSSIVDWLGLKSDDPVLTSNVRATSANDDYEWSFEKIADAIERTYL